MIVTCPPSTPVQNHRNLNTESSNPNERLFNLGATVFLGLICWAVWGATLDYGFAWDDDYYIVQNPALRDWSYLPRYFTDVTTMAGGRYAENFKVFRPLRNISYLIDYSIAGLWPPWWHSHHLLLHFVNGLLVFVLAGRLVRSRTAAVFAAALFLIHPVQSEVVCWLKGRDDLLMVFYVLLCVLVWTGRPPRRSFALQMALLSFLFFAACLSKVQAVILPGLLLALGFFRRPRSGADEASEKFTYLSPRQILIAVSILMVQAGVIYVWRDRFIRTNVVEDYVPETFSQTLLIVVQTFGHYFNLLVFPLRLRIEYDAADFSAPWGDAGVGLSVVLVGVAAALPWFARRRFPIEGFGVLWILGFLLIVSRLIPAVMNSMGHGGGIPGAFPILAERFLYVPAIGLALLSGALLARIEARSLAAASAVALILIGAMGYRARERAKDWATEERLYTVTVRDAQPGSIRPLRNLLRVKVHLGKYGEALPLALRLRDSLESNYVLSQSEMAEAVRYVGYAMVQTGDRAGGERELLRAIELDPTYPAPILDLGVLRGQAGDHADALGWFDRAVEIQPNDSMSHFYRGTALRQTGNDLEAERAFLVAIDIGPTRPEFFVFLGRLYRERGDRAKAMTVLESGLPLWPDDPSLRVALAEVRGAP